MRRVFLIAMAGGCSSNGDLSMPPPPEAPPPPLALTVDEPAYGAYVGNHATVSGSVTDPDAAVWIEGYRANVGANGSFRVEVPVTGDFRVIDVEAIRGPERGAPGEHLRDRVPVFSGSDPLASWPGGLGIRLTPVALDHVSELIAAQVAAIDLPGKLAAILPSLQIGTWRVTETHVPEIPPAVTLIPSDQGLALDVDLGRMTADYELDTGGTTLPLTLGVDDLAFAATVTVSLDQGGGGQGGVAGQGGALSLGVSGAQVTVGNPVLVVDGLDPTILENLLSGLASGLGSLASNLLTAGLGLVGDFSVPLGSIDASSLGLPLSLSVDRVATDADGVAVDVGVDLGVPAVGTPLVPSLVQSGPQADLALSIHEGLLTGLLNSDLLSALDLGTIELPGLLGNVVAVPISALPLGDQLPADRTGMCLTLDPGTARTARLEDTLTPLGVITLPDVHVGVAVSTPTEHCAPWLDTSLALQIDLNLVGTTLSPRIQVVDGAVLSYAADGTYDEDEIVGGLGALVDSVTSLLGGSLQIDLGSVLAGAQGGALGDLNPTILDLDPVFDADGHRVDGLRILQISLWD